VETNEDHKKGEREMIRNIKVFAFILAPNLYHSENCDTTKTDLVL
jgi:hypothetical protein